MKELLLAAEGDPQAVMALGLGARDLAILQSLLDDLQPITPLWVELAETTYRRLLEC